MLPLGLVLMHLFLTRKNEEILRLREELKLQTAAARWTERGHDDDDARAVEQVNVSDLILDE